MPSRRTWLKGVGAAATLSVTGLSGCLGGDDGSEGGDDGEWPSEPVRFVFPFSQGGGTDTNGRQLASALEDRIDQPTQVENITGAGTMRAASEVYNAAPDGHTLFFTNTPSTPVGGLAEEPDFPIKDFHPLGSVSEGPYALVVDGSVEADNIHELMELTESGSLPNNYGVSFASTTHLVGLTISELWDWDLNLVGYDGTGAIAQALASGEIAMFASTAPAVEELVNDGTAKVIMALHTDGVPEFPDAPTPADEGLETLDFAGNVIRFVMGHPDSPEEVRNKQIELIEDVAGDESFQEATEEGGSIANYRGPDELQELLDEAYETIPQMVNLDDFSG